MKFSEATDKIIPALFQFRSKAETPKKNKFNPHFKSYYADLQSVIDAISPAMQESELFHLQETVTNDKGETGVYTIFIHKSSGQSVEFNPVFIPGKSNNAQAEGSILSYARRYSLSLAAGVASDEDDDAEGAMPVKQQTQRQKYQQKQPVQQKPQTKAPSTPKPAPVPAQPVAKMTEETLTKIKNVWESTNLAPNLINKQTDKYFKLPLNELSESQGKQLLEIFEAKKSETKEQKKNRYAALFAAGKEQRLSTDQVKELVYSKYSIESLTKLDDDTLEKATKWIKSGGKEDPAEDSRKKLMEDMKKIANGQKKVS